jgi:hypothetical protein
MDLSLTPFLALVLPMKSTLRVLIVALGMAVATKADMVGYGGRHDCSTSSEGFVFRHEHDWNWPALDKLMSQHGGDLRAIFSTDNTFSYVELLDRDGKQLFRRPSPALTHLWISPEAKYLVGISNVMLRNPYQLVIWQSDGSLVHARHVSDTVARMTRDARIEFIRRFPGAEAVMQDDYFVHEDNVYLAYWHHGGKLPKDAWNYLEDLRVRNPISKDIRSSVTNWIWWFDERNPAISLKKNGNDLLLTLRSRGGLPVSLTIPPSPPKLTTKP